MWDLLKARPARRVALEILGPYVERLTADGQSVPSGAWMGPHVLGFLSKLVTMIALHESGGLQPYAMASVQSSVITTLTGAGPEMVGAEIHLLSSTGNGEFEAGCRGAVQFFNAMLTIRRGPDDGQAHGEAGVIYLDDIWQEHVAARLHDHRVSY